MTVSIAHRARRDLGELPSYRGLEGSLPATLQGLATLVGGESVIGIYQDESSDIKNAILITDCGVHIASPGQQFVPYKAILSVQPYTTSKVEMIEKATSRQIVLELEDGSSVNIP